MSSCLMRLRQNMATCGLLMSLAKITSTRANILPRWFYPPPVLKRTVLAAA